MNRKDMRELGRKSAAKNAPHDATHDATHDALHNALHDALHNALHDALHNAPHKMTYGRAWLMLYGNVVGGHVGWLLSGISDREAFERRLKTLSEVATSALNFAIREKKVQVENV